MTTAESKRQSQEELVCVCGVGPFQTEALYELHKVSEDHAKRLTDMQSGITPSAMRKGKTITDSLPKETKDALEIIKDDAIKIWRNGRMDRTTRQQQAAKLVRFSFAKYDLPGYDGNVREFLVNDCEIPVRDTLLPHPEHRQEFTTVR